MRLSDCRGSLYHTRYSSSTHSSLPPRKMTTPIFTFRLMGNHVRELRDQASRPDVDPSVALSLMYQAETLEQECGQLQLAFELEQAKTVCAMQQELEDARTQLAANEKKEG